MKVAQSNKTSKILGYLEKIDVKFSNYVTLFSTDCLVTFSLVALLTYLVKR